LKVNWVFEADIRGYFDAIDHEGLMSYIERRVGDTRILRLIRKWLKAGIIEEGVFYDVEKGTPQGSSISPLLGNIYLHYVFDTWAHQWRKTNAYGDVVIVRYADDFVVGFQHRVEAERFQEVLHKQFAANHLELHPEKTRLIEFGRFAARDRRRRGQGKPETFDFLGFTHLCGQSRKGTFLLRRHTIKKRLRRRLKAIREGLRKRMCDPVDMTGTWLLCVLSGYYRYFAVPTNLRALKALRREVSRAWLFFLRRRSHKDHTTWKDFGPVVAKWLPIPQYCHIWPEQRMQERLTRGRSRMR
jgi:group II intron reverse transcriptase/maturase